MARDKYKRSVLSRCAGPCLLALFSTACVQVNYIDRDARFRDDNDESLKERFYDEHRLATIHFSDDEELKGSDPKLNVTKIRKGYALTGIIEEDRDSNTSLMLAKDKDRKWFAGVQYRWTF